MKRFFRISALKRFSKNDSLPEIFKESSNISYPKCLIFNLKKKDEFFDVNNSLLNERNYYFYEILNQKNQDPFAKSRSLCFIYFTLFTKYNSKEHLGNLLKEELKIVEHLKQKYRSLDFHRISMTLPRIIHGKTYSKMLISLLDSHLSLLCEKYSKENEKKEMNIDMINFLILQMKNAYYSGHYEISMTFSKYNHLFNEIKQSKLVSLNLLMFNELLKGILNLLIKREL
jgi:hypothetical protein